MNTDEAIESFCAFARPRNIRCEIPYFFLGDEEDADRAIDLIKDDLKRDLAVRIPFPFTEQVILVKTENNPAFKVALELADSIGAPRPEWSATFVASIPGQNDAMFCWDCSFFRKLGWFAVSGGAISLGLSDQPELRYLIGDMAVMFDPLRGKFVERKSWSKLQEGMFVKSALATAYHLALICHPENYIVKETPLLTSHEAKRIESGKRFPDAKRPRYLIVDHDVLVGRLKPHGTHASPIPHQRRGHWMRLAERCKHLRARGVDKVYVKDCNVGPSDFIVNNRRYQVLLGGLGDGGSA